ncbi:MAG: hypothetical protein AAGC61_01900 [Microbacterium sp.]
MEQFVLSSPEVLQLRAAHAQPSTEYHIGWDVTFATDIGLVVESVSYWSVIGTLHVGDATGWGDISVGALLAVHGDPPDDVERALRDSEALETLYDIARNHLRPLLSTIDSDASLPRKSPDATVERYEDSDDDDTATQDVEE